MQNFLKGEGVGRASSSKPRRAGDDISIYFGLPKTTTRNPKWPEDHNVILGELLLEQYVNGSFCNGNMRKEHWASLVAVLNRRLSSNYTDSSVMIRFKNMKVDFRTLYQLTNRSGWGWDEELHIPVATDELWDEIQHAPHQYDIFEKICAENIAVGSDARCIMSNYLCGVLPDVLCNMVDLQIQVNNVIAEITPSLIQESSSSDDEELIRRTMFDRTYTEHRYVIDVLAGHPGRAYQCFRLPPYAFISLRDLLVSRGHLRDTKNMLAAEQLGIFLRGVAHAHSYRQLCEFFQHSPETVSRYFNIVLRAIVSFTDEFINLPQGEPECHPFVRSNTLFHPYFKNALGAIDGTHIPAVVSSNIQNRYHK
ncbi:hypothetical protein M5K25_018834 [Dendrobium thyrsiflorum]|uniref:Myb/SANT-like domain-containing protein n=1 Tax=Dendrobium thyrsiflorum TaxID=117978 RepID=A0ABD0UD76_DENTH